MVFTEVSHESWFSRIGGAIKGVFFGLLLLVVSFVLLFWNEGRSVARYKTLKEGGGVVVTIDSESVDADNASKLVHLTGMADTSADLTDSVFGVSEKALRISRIVEIYQWQETSKTTSKKKVGGGKKKTTSYTHSKIWSDMAINSSGFKDPEGHQNSGSMKYRRADHFSKNITIGAFTLSPSLTAKINNFEALPITSNTAIPESLKGKAVVDDGGFYIGADPSSPAIGDMRVKFTIARPTDISVVAKQVGNSFSAYGTTTGGSIELLQTGIYSAKDMIQKAQASNKMLTWGLRLAGFIVMFIGLSMILHPLSVLADVIPILGSIVGAGTAAIAAITSGVLSLITIAIAWIVYRPVLGVILILAAVGLTVLIVGKLKSAKTAA